MRRWRKLIKETLNTDWSPFFCFLCNTLNQKENRIDEIFDSFHLETFEFYSMNIFSCSSVRRLTILSKTHGHSIIIYKTRFTIHVHLLPFSVRKYFKMTNDKPIKMSKCKRKSTKSKRIDVKVKSVFDKSNDVSIMWCDENDCVIAIACVSNILSSIDVFFCSKSRNERKFVIKRF